MKLKLALELKVEEMCGGVDEKLLKNELGKLILLNSTVANEYLTGYLADFGQHFIAIKDAKRFHYGSRDEMYNDAIKYLAYPESLEPEEFNLMKENPLGFELEEEIPMYYVAKTAILSIRPILEEDIKKGIKDFKRYRVKE